MALLEEIWQTLLQVKLPLMVLAMVLGDQRDRGTRDREGNISKNMTLKTPEKLLSFHKYMIKANCQGVKRQILIYRKNKPC